MAKALQCDRCGQFYGLLKGLRNYQIRDMNEKNFDKQVDLCPDCYEIFTKWLAGEKEQKVGTGELYPGEFESRHYEFEEDYPDLPMGEFKTGCSCCNPEEDSE